ncbi:MAG: hypothetical protein KBT88_12475 [Gammaproteobacteria bacterium]|nr:hypothetical protein [Gammaproteobacteria bacterium]MBQ0840591.1 hypothetical protein [Gammaproteobacteria bacterium]
MIKITRLNHSAIGCRVDVEEMHRFYVDILGVNTSERDIPEHLAALIPGFWMQFPNGQVHVIQCDKPGEERKVLKELAGKPGDPMGPHTAFYVEDIDAVETHLTANNIAYHRMDQFIFSSDPEGNTVEFQQDPEISSD